LSTDIKGAMANSKGSIGAGVAWMFLISILLFWLPVFGPLVAGFVGGKKSGGVGAALFAVFAPAVFFAVVLFAFATFFTGVPVFGALVGAGGFFLLLAEIGPLLVGAIVGGATA
jgi:hypothetical protein